MKNKDVNINEEILGIVLETLGTNSEEENSATNSVAITEVCSNEFHDDYGLMIQCSLENMSRDQFERIKDLGEDETPNKTRKHILTKEDFDNYPEMSLNGWKVGDVVTIGATVPPLALRLLGENFELKKRILAMKNYAENYEKIKNNYWGTLEQNDACEFGLFVCGIVNPHG